MTYSYFRIFHVEWWAGVGITEKEPAHFCRRWMMRSRALDKSSVEWPNMSQGRHFRVTDQFAITKVYELNPSQVKCTRQGLAKALIV
jgi:hypothetical protein